MRISILATPRGRADLFGPFVTRLARNVLGPDHVDNFARLLQDAEYQIQLIGRRWEACPLAQTERQLR